MAQTVTIELSKGEAEQLSAMLDKCVAMLRESNERGERKQAEITRLKIETQALLKQIEEMLNVETDFRPLHSTFHGYPTTESSR